MNKSRQEMINGECRVLLTEPPNPELLTRCAYAVYELVGVVVDDQVKRDELQPNLSNAFIDLHNTLIDHPEDIDTDQLRESAKEAIEKHDVDTRYSKSFEQQLQTARNTVETNRPATEFVIGGFNG